MAVEAATAKRKALITEKKSYEERLDVLEGPDLRPGRLRGDFDLARETYFMYEKKAEEARVSRAMDEENIVNAGVVQEAKAPDHPAAAQPPDLGTGVGHGRGLPSASPSPSSSSSSASPSRTSATSEQFLQVPVLATVRHF